MAGELQGLGQWRLLDLCAEGEFAAIYRARPGTAAATESDVALKVVRTESLHDELDTEAFADRSSRAVALSDTAPHPAIVRVSGHGEVDGRAWAAMELVDGLSLDRMGGKRSRGRLPVEGAVVVLRQVLAALDAALGCVSPTSHGRLGRSHILIDVGGAVRIIGFGSADRAHADLLAIGRLANKIAKTWPGEMDAWIDKLTDGDDAFDTAAEALEAFPMSAFEADVLEKGQKALARAVVRERKKAAKAAEKALEAEVEAPAEDADPSPGDAEPLGPGPISDPEECHSTVRQARGVTWACAAVVLVAVAIELLRFGG